MCNYGLVTHQIMNLILWKTQGFLLSQGSSQAKRKGGGAMFSLSKAPKSRFNCARVVRQRGWICHKLHLLFWVTLVYLFKTFFSSFHPSRDFMLISAKFSYHLNKAYSIIACAASNKLKLEEERFILTQTCPAGRKGYKWLSLFLVVMIFNRDQYQLNLCVFKHSHSLEIVLQPLQMSPQCLSFIVPSFLNPSLDSYQHSCVSFR